MPPTEETEAYPIPRSLSGVQALSARAAFWYLLANLGYGMFYALNNFSLGLYLKQFTANNVLLNLMGSSHSFEGAIIQPLVGNASDRLRTPGGRRRPFMLIFTPLSALFLLLTPAAAQLPSTVRLGGLVLCIFLFTVLFNVAQDPYQALLSDITRPEQRGRITGIWMFVGVFGQALTLLLPLSFEMKCYLTAGIMLLTTGLTCANTREPALPEPDAYTRRQTQILATLGGLRTLKQVRKAIAALFFLGFGIGAVLPSLARFVQAITHCSDGTAERMPLVLIAMTALGVLPCGWITDRIGPKKMLLAGMTLIGVAAINGLWVTSLPQIAVVLIVAGLGNAAQSASAYPLLTRLVPPEEIGFYVGLQTTAFSIAAPLTSILTGVLTNQGGFRYIFAVCAVSVTVALLILSSLRLEFAADEIVLRKREIERGVR